MEGRRRRSFTQDYKPQAANLVVSSGRSVTSVAKEVGLSASVLRRWVDKLSAGHEPTAAPQRPITQAALPSADQAAEIARLQRENDRLRMESSSPVVGIQPRRVLIMQAPAKTAFVVVGGLAAALLIAGTLAVTISRPAKAKPEWSAQTKKPCGFCHQNPAGAGPLTPAGAKFKANDHKL